MRTEQLIKMASAALCDVLCDGCEDGEDMTEIYGSCSKCMAHAAQEIAERLREKDTRKLSIYFDTDGDTPDDREIVEIDAPAYAYGWKPLAFKWEGL